MPSKLDVLEQLKEDELMAAIDRFGLEIHDRRARAGLIEALAGSLKATLAETLADLPQTRLKEICRALDLDDSGGEKAVLVARLTGPANGSKPGPSAASAPPAGKLTPQALERHLWSAADIVQSSAVDGSDVKNYILGLLLLKRLLDRFEEEREIVSSEGGDPEDPDEYPFYVPPGARWERLRSLATNLGEELNRATAALEERNPSFEGVLYGLDYNDEQKLGDIRQRDQLLGNLLLHFSALDLRNANLSEPDMLGRAYEYLNERFAEGAGKEAGEFYTPHQVVRLMVEILQPHEGMRICDPTCGSGGMLIQCAEHVARNGGNPRNLSLCGQEKNLSAWATCKLNLLLYGTLDARIVKGDTIRDPRLQENGDLMRFDIVISNPPISISNWGWELAEHDPWRRFRFGMPPKERGDYAFLQHMISVLGPQGKLAALIPQAALSRGGREAQIRQRLVETDLIEAIIYLPSGTLETTPVAPAILIVNRAKPPERQGKILLVQAAGESENSRLTRQRWDRTWMDSMVAAVQEFREEKQRSKVVTLDETANHKFDLQASLYFETLLPGERLDRMADVLQSRGYSASTSSKVKVEEVPVVQGRDLGVRRLTLDDLARWPAPDRSARPVFIQEGDILIQRIGEKPKATIAGKELAGALASDTVYVIRLREDHKKKGHYLVGFFNSPAGHRQIARSRPSAVIPTLSPRPLRGLRIPLPDLRLIELLDRVRGLEDDLFDRVEKALAIRSKLFEAHDPATFETEVRRLSLDAKLLRESVVRSEDLDFQVRNFYPHMVAYRYRRLSSIYDPGKRYTQQLRLLDTLLVFLGSVGLALATSVGKPDLLKDCEIGKEQLVKIWTGGASDGHWAALGRGAARVLKREGGSPAANAFAAMWSSKLDGTLGHLIKTRNDDAHRQKERSSREFEQASEEIEKRLQEVLRASLFFVQHPIRLVESISLPWRSKDAVLNTLVYSGDHPGLRREEVRYPTALSEGHLYLELEPGSWLPLYPLLSVEEVGGERRTYAVDRFEAERRRARLKGLESGHDPSPEHAKRVGEDFSVWLDDIFGSEEAHAVEA